MSFHKINDISDLFNKKKTKQKNIQQLNQIQNILNRKYHFYNHNIKYINTDINTNINTDINTDINTHNNSDNHIDIYKNSVHTFHVPFNLSLENDYKMISKKFNPTVSINDIYNKNLNLNIHYGIHTHIKMDNTIGNFIYHDLDNDEDIMIDTKCVERIRKKGIRTIVHVYQENYKDHIHCTGFGDFIRSCFFIVQFCINFNFEYKIIVNHPIAEFLEYFYTIYKKIKTNDQNQRQFQYIQMMTSHNFVKSICDTNYYIEKYILSGGKFNDFVDYICELPVTNRTVYSYNIFFPYNDTQLNINQNPNLNINTLLCNQVRSFFHPTKEIDQEVDAILRQLSLIKHQFIVLHIRSGDKYLNDNYKLFDTQYFKKICNEINIIIHSFTNVRENNNINLNILLITDNNEIKLLLKKEFPFIKFLMNDITHTGENIVLDKKKIKNTMVDFFLMSNACSIYSFTIYSHGSGFSYWCAKMYGIPYKCKWIV